MEGIHLDVGGSGGLSDYSISHKAFIHELSSQDVKMECN